MSSKVYSVGVIGYGLSAKVFHIPFINAVPDFKLYSIVQRNPKSNDDASKDHPDIKLYKSAEEQAQDPEVDVIVVSTPPELHLQQVKMAIEAGKHVVVEKPFAPTFEEANEMVQLAKSTGVLLTVFQNRRWDSDFLTLQKYIKDGTLGRIVEFETHFDRHRPGVPPDSWKVRPTPGVGAVYDLGVHMMDQVVHLFGLPEKITGFVGSQRHPNPSGLEDSCTVLMHYDGMLATVKAGVVSPEVNQLRFWVRGVKGSFKKFGLDPQEDQLRSKGVRPGDKGYGIESEESYGTLIVDEGGKLTSSSAPTVHPPPTYVAYYERVAEALKKGFEHAPVDAAENAQVIRLIELARESSQSGKTLDV